MTTAPPNRDYIDQMAAHWLTAEREANPAAYADPSVDFVSMLEIARDRVLKIYDGEVKWSECSAGDKVAWLGRPRQRSIYQAFGRQGRERAKREQDWATFRGRAFSAGCRERVWWNYFDTVTLGGKHRPRNHARAFGNPNIGNFRRTNMVIGEQLPGDFTMVVMDFYVVPCAPAHEVPWNRIVGELVVGQRPVTPKLPLAELFMGCALWERPCIIPVRQAFYASLDIDEAPDEPLDLVVHIEGLVTRDIQ